MSCISSVAVNGIAAQLAISYRQVCHLVECGVADLAGQSAGHDAILTSARRLSLVADPGHALVPTPSRSQPNRQSPNRADKLIQSGTH